MYRRRLASVLLLAALGTVGCRKEDMSSQPKFYHPYKQTAQFADGTTARPIPEGTVARGHLALSTPLYTGAGDDFGPDGYPIPISYIPVDVGLEDLDRGQQKFNIYCAPCHGKVGDGGGMIVARGMPRPPSLVWVDRPMTAREVNVQRAPVGHYFQVISNGYGAMYSYNDKLSVEDRWRVVAYLKTLQLSQDGDQAHLTLNIPNPKDVALEHIPQQTDVHQPYGREKSPPPLDDGTYREPAAGNGVNGQSDARPAGPGQDDRKSYSSPGPQQTAPPVGSTGTLFKTETRPAQ